MPSPARDRDPTILNPPLVTELQPPPSPRTHRALRRLQSAHTLGASRDNPNRNSLPSAPSLISQQRQQQQTRSGSPTRSAAGHSGAHRRARANSDATPPLVHQHNLLHNLRRPSSQKPVFSHGHLSLDKIIREGPADGDFNGALESARWKVVDEGVKSADDGMSTVRIYVWLIMLDAPVLGTDDYLKLIHRGASPAYSKIRNDTFRTLTTDPLFRRRVSEASLIRLLNAVAWTMYDAREEEKLVVPEQKHSMARVSLASNASESESSTFLTAKTN